MHKPETIRVLLVDDHQLVRESCRALLAAMPSVKIVGEADNGLLAVQLANELEPDIIIMDVTMHKMGGIEATRLITESLRHTRVLCLSMHSSPSIIAAAMNAGAVGYVCKTCPPSELLTAIRRVADGSTYLSPIAADAVNADRTDEPDSDSPLARLSDREKDVLRLIADGHSTETIARELNISGKTVFCHRNSLLKKLQMTSIAELTKFAIREGLATI